MCVCVCVCICTHACTCVYMHTWMYVCVRMLTYVLTECMKFALPYIFVQLWCQINRDRILCTFTEWMLTSIILYLDKLLMSTDHDTIVLYVHVVIVLQIIVSFCIAYVSMSTLYNFWPVFTWYNQIQWEYINLVELPQGNIYLTIILASKTFKYRSVQPFFPRKLSRTYFNAPLLIAS